MKVKKPTKKDEKRVQDFIAEFEFLFGLQGFDRSVTFKTVDYKDRAADITLEFDYARVHINIYPLFWDGTLAQQRMYLLHEFIHSWVEPLDDIAFNLQEGKLETQEHRRFAVEKVTSTITNTLDGLLRGRYKYARRAYAKYIIAKPCKSKRKG